MARKRIEYEEITCDRCGASWRTDREYQSATLTRIFHTSTPDGGGTERADWDLCPTCSGALDDFMKIGG